MEKILEILADIHPEYEYDKSEDFIEEGLLDSFDIVALVSELEENYNILIDALDIIPENFCSAKAIADVVVKNGGSL